MAYQLLKKRTEYPAVENHPISQPQTHQPAGAGLEGDGMGARLDAQMQARMQRFLDHQNPQAEQEADEIAASVSTARTPQEVKTQLGERMGADFSDVRFHMGAAAQRKADEIGARAYAAGRDVYFGEGGFDPAVAAHELVHTAQQGVVDSGMATQSMPAGTIQMMPKLLSKAGSAIKKGASAVWGGIKRVGSAIKNFFTGGGGQQAAAPAAPAPAPAPAPAAPRYANEQEEYQALADQMKAGYANATMEGNTPQERYISFLANYNRNNANFPAFKSSTNRVRGGQVMDQVVDNVIRNIGGRHSGEQGAAELSRIGGLNKDELQTDAGAVREIQSVSSDMMDQMSVLMDDPEFQRYIQANASGFRGATAGRQGTEDFFGDDHMLALTLLNNMNLYNLNPSITTQGRAHFQQAGLGMNSFATINKLSQSSTGLFNGMTSLHARLGENVGADRAGEMAQTLRSGKGKVISDEEALLNLRNNHAREGRTEFTPEEINQERESLYASKRNDAYTEEGVRKYLALYQKMRQLIGQRQG